MLNSKVSKAVRLAFAFGAASSSVFSANTIAAEGAEKVERIQVTGSRIKRTDLETAVPITTIGKAEIGETGTLNVQDILSRSPVALAGSDQSSSTFTTTTVGLNTTELRGLGESRTLILVNGRRFVSGMIPSVGYAVDLNAIPAKLIERIDILKSASSAIYGSDAVAGVVNIILRDDIEGVEISGQTGLSAESDREKHSFNITAGNTWDSGNAWFSVGYDTDKGIKAVDRSYSARDIMGTEDGEIVPLNSSYPPAGRFGHRLLKNDEGETITTRYNSDGTPYTAENSFNRAQYRQLITPLERKYVSGSLNLEVSDNVTMFTEFQWNSAATDDSTIEPVPLHVGNAVWFNDKGGSFGMSIDSPLIPEGLRASLAADGVTNLNQGNLVRRLVEFGARDTSLERDTTRVATGFNWDIDGNWMLETYGTFGQTTQTQQNGGQVNIERARFALDVERFEGELRCKDEHARFQGCVPMNIFGAGAISDEAVAYVSSPAKVYGKVEQTVFSSVLSGELPLELEGGQVAFAGGVEYRYEKGIAQPGDLAQTGAASTNKAAPTAGSFSSTDYFAEASLPILENARLDLAARYSDHSVVGSTFTYNIGAEYRPLETLMVRASYATAVRTPNIANLYGGKGETFRTVTDPCNGLQQNGSDEIDAVIRTNCMKDPAIVARLQAEGKFELTQVERQGTGGFRGGNENIKEETAKTLSVGAVWQATEELSITFDYFDIEIEDAITTLLRTDVIKRCYDDADMVQGCGGTYLRNSGTGALIEVNSFASNENTIETSGIDLEIDYKVDTDFGTVGASLVFTHTRDFLTTSQISGAEEDDLGEVENPENRFNLNLTYGHEDISARWRLRYWDDVVDSNTPSLPDAFNEVDAVVYHDASVGYNFGNDTKVTFGINNVFDKQPPILPQFSTSGSTGINTNSAAYNIEGRAFYFNFDTKF